MTKKTFIPLSIDGSSSVPLFQLAFEVGMAMGLSISQDSPIHLQITADQYTISPMAHLVSYINSLAQSPFALLCSPELAPSAPESVDELASLPHARLSSSWVDLWPMTESTHPVRLGIYDAACRPNHPVELLQNGSHYNHLFVLSSPTQEKITLSPAFAQPHANRVIPVDSESLPTSQFINHKTHYYFKNHQRGVSQKPLELTILPTGYGPSDMYSFLYLGIAFCVIHFDSITHIISDHRVFFEAIKKTRDTFRYPEVNQVWQSVTNHNERLAFSNR